MKNILAAIDLSPVTQEVLRVAADIAHKRQCTLWLVHVAAPDPDLAGFEAGPQIVRDQRAQALRDEHVELQGLAADLAGKGMDARPLLVQGPTVATILEQAGRLEADLIVMGSHGRGALHRLFAGSVCQQVLADTPVPLLVVPAHRKG